MLTKQQAVIIEHLKRTGQNASIKVDNPRNRELAEKLLPMHKFYSDLYGGTPDQLQAYYEAVNVAHVAIA